MRFSNRGRAHLEALLGKAEKVVRVSPADVIVLTGVDTERAGEMGDILSFFNQFGIEARGVVILGEGMDLDSIDVEELIRMDQLADEVDEGGVVTGNTSIEGLSIGVRCPRCDDVVSMEVTASIQDTGDRLVGGASVDDRDLELHGMMCAGRKKNESE